jgi:hypothetical protein
MSGGAPLPEMVPTVIPEYVPPPHGIREFPVSRQFCEVERTTRNVLTTFMQASTPEDTDDTYFVATDPPLDLDATPRRRMTQVLRHIGGTEVGWEETLTLGQMIEAAVAETYVDVDKVYTDAVGNRTMEYTIAEAEARAYLAAEVKPESVSSFIEGPALSNPTGEVQSYEWASQQIVERADALKWAVGRLREVRMARQKDMRAATSEMELAMAVATWMDFIRWIRGVLGI